MCATSEGSCETARKALARLRGYAVSPEPSLFAYAMSTKTSCAGSFITEQFNDNIAIYMTAINIRIRSKAQYTYKVLLFGHVAFDKLMADYI